MKMPTAWPRARGVTGQVETPPEHAGKWVWTMFVVIQSTTEEEMPVREINSWELQPERFFNTVAEAEKDLEKEAVHLCEVLNKSMGGTGKEGFFDMMDEMKHKVNFGGSDART